jgi:hypothetical protein
LLNFRVGLYNTGLRNEGEILNFKYSRRSIRLIFIFVISIVLSYVVSGEFTEKINVLIIKILYFIATVSGVLSLFNSYLAYKNKEEGVMKHLGPITILFVLFAFLIIVYWAFIV